MPRHPAHSQDQLRLAASRYATICERRRLQQRAPEEWAQAVAQLPADQRAETAAVIWWDFFSQRTSGAAWPHLDRYLAELPPLRPTGLHQKQIATALMRCGYSRAQAARRLHRFFHRPPAHHYYDHPYPSTRLHAHATRNR
jgi:hypothetical protein